MKKSLLVIILLSLGVAIGSPYFFDAYVHEKPLNLERKLNFGGPFPFFEQEIEYPEDKAAYPLEIPFTSYFDNEMNFKIIAFLLSFACFFLMFYSIYAIVIHYTNRRQERVAEEMERKREDLAIARNKSKSHFSKQ